MGYYRRAVIVLALLSCSAPSWAAENLGQLITDVQTLTLDTVGTRQHFSTTSIAGFINEGQREILMGTHCMQNTTTFMLTPGTTYYPMPTNYLVIERVTIGYKMIPQMTPAALDSQSLGWEYASGYPNRYFINFSSRDLIGFAPFPQTSTDTDTIKVDFDIQANDMVVNGDLPYNGINEFQDYSHGLAYWAASTIEQVDNQPNRAAYYMSIFTNVSKIMSVRCRDLKNYLPSASGQQ